MFAAVAIAWAAVLLRPGSAKSNRYVPSVTHPLVPAFGGGRRRAGGLVAAVALTVSGAGLGYADNAWLDRLRWQHEAIEHDLATDPRSVGTAAPDPLERAYRKQNGQ